MGLGAGVEEVEGVYGEVGVWFGSGVGEEGVGEVG